MTNLRTQIIKLAHQKPELRQHLVPLLRQGATNPDWLGDALQNLSEDYSNTRSALKPINHAITNGKPLTSDMIKTIQEAVKDDLKDIQEDGYVSNGHKAGRALFDKIQAWAKKAKVASVHLAGCEKLPEGGMRDNCEKKVEEGKGKTAANTEWLDDVLRDLGKDYTATRGAFKPVNYARVNSKPITDSMIKDLREAIQEDLADINENGYMGNAQKATRPLFDKIQAWAKTLKPSKTASARQAGYSFAEDTAWFAFVGNKTPFNVDVIERINYTAIPFRDEDGKMQEDLGMRVSQPISYSPSLTRGQEMAGAVREIVFAVKYPRGSLRQAQAALTAIGKALKFQVEYLPSPRKAVTRQKTR